MRDVLLEVAGSFEEALRDGERIVAYGVGPHGDPLALVVNETDADAPFGEDEEPGWATFPRPRADHAYAACVLHLAADLKRITLADMDTTFPRVQPLPDDEVLIVGSRCERRNDGSYDLNGRVYGRDGRLRREFVLGDGIEDVQATADGRIWVSYFDEGVFGNFGWGNPGGPDPIGAAGLIRWECGRSEGMGIRATDRRRLHS